MTTNGDPNDLRYERETRLLSREELAERAGVHWSTVRAIERGWHRPQLRTRRWILGALDIPVEEHRRVCGPTRSDGPMTGIHPVSQEGER